MYTFAGVRKFVSKKTKKREKTVKMIFLIPCQRMFNDPEIVSLSFSFKEQIQHFLMNVTKLSEPNIKTNVQQSVSLGMRVNKGFCICSLPYKPSDPLLSELIPVSVA